jgi:hypothetical protein
VAARPASTTTDPEEVLSGVVADLESLATEIVVANEASPQFNDREMYVEKTKEIVCLVTQLLKSWKKQKK